MLNLIVSLTLLDGQQVGVSLLNLRTLFGELLGGVTVVETREQQKKRVLVSLVQLQVRHEPTDEYLAVSNSRREAN